jgi:hypothetical protein
VISGDSAGGGRIRGPIVNLGIGPLSLPSLDVDLASI